MYVEGIKIIELPIDIKIFDSSVPYTIHIEELMTKKTKD